MCRAVVNVETGARCINLAKLKKWFGLVNKKDYTFTQYAGVHQSYCRYNGRWNAPCLCRVDVRQMAVDAGWEISSKLMQYPIVICRREPLAPFGVLPPWKKSQRMFGG